MRGSRRFCQRGSNFDVFCLFVCFMLFFSLMGGGGGGNDPNTTISGPDSERAFRCIPIMAQY